MRRDAWKGINRPFWQLAKRVQAVSAFILLAATAAFAEDPSVATYSARDSLDAPRDANADAQACIELLVWTPGAFKVECTPAVDQQYDALVAFPSPLSSGDPVNDRVTMEWYRPRSQAGAGAAPRPAMVVIHESGSQMEAGRVFARTFRERGLNAFLIHLPYYGERRKGGGRPENADFTVLVRQGIADARRARDAVAVLPGVDAEQIAIQGTSLGGFVATLVGSLDQGYDGVFIMLAGADFYDILQTGQKDTAKLRQKFTEAGFEGEELKTLLSAVESQRIAHRLDPAHTWMYSAQDDEVVPIKNARLLAATAGLDRSHQSEMPGGHYSVALYFPFIVDHVLQQMKLEAGSE